MIASHVFDEATALVALTVCASLSAGALVGALHFLTLQWSVRRLMTCQPILLVLTIQLVRYVAVALALGIIARRFGAVPLLVATAGILAARSAVLRWGEPLP
jgi:F1F0 ATPase subunit 2